MKHATTIIALAFIGFAIALAISIGSRLNEQAIALLAGTACGVGIAAPLGVAIGLYAAAQRRRDRDATPPPPPIIVMPQPPPSPPPLPAPLLPNFAPMPRRRTFNVIGDSGLEDEK